MNDELKNDKIADGENANDKTERGVNENCVEKNVEKDNTHEKNAELDADSSRNAGGDASPASDRKNERSDASGDSALTPKRQAFGTSRVFAAAFLVLVIAETLIAFFEPIFGRRAAKVVAYRLNCLYWPDWLSIVCWISAVGLANVLWLQRRIRYGFKSSCRLFKRANADNNESKTSSVKIAVCAYAALIAAVLCYLFVDVQPFWRFLKYKLYADYFQTPVVHLTEDGVFSPKLLTGPAIVAVICVLYFMRKKIGNFFVLFVALCLANPCLMAEETIDKGPAPKKIRMLEPAECSTIADIEKIAETPSAKNPDGGYDADSAILKCFAVMDYFYTGGRYDNEQILFRMRFPLREEPGKKYPLIVYFHGYGESTGDNKRHLAHLHHAIKSFVGKDALDFYMIAVQCPPDNMNWDKSISSEGKGDARMTIVGEIMEAVVDEFPVDENRIDVVGISSGASAVWDFAEAHEGKFAALVAFSGTPSRQASVDAFKNTAIWAFNNKGDTGSSWKDTSNFIKRINAAGGNGYVTLRNHGIHDSWSLPLKNDSVFEWVVSQTRDGKGRLQDVPYPERSWTAIFFKFLLPLTIVIASLAALRFGR